MTVSSLVDTGHYSSGSFPKLKSLSSKISQRPDTQFSNTNNFIKDLEEGPKTVCSAFSIIEGQFIAWIYFCYSYYNSKWAERNWISDWNK